MKKQIVISDRYSQRNDVAQLCNIINHAFDGNDGELIYDKRNKLRRFTMKDGLVIIAKRYKKPNIFQKICYSTFWKNKAKKSFIFADYLLNIGIETPAPIAHITYKEKGMVDEYFLLTEEASGEESEVLMNKMSEENDVIGMHRLADALTDLLIKMHEKGFMHGDANLSNFLCQKSDEGYAFSVIDINRSKILHRPASYKECINNLYRVTHIRPILSMIVKTYARHRGWDEDKVEKDVIAALERFEKRKALHKKLKN